MAMRNISTILAGNEIEQFQHNGFLTLETLIPDEEIEQLRQIYDRLFAEKTD